MIFPLSIGDKQLAAIVFSDIVEFSARTGRNEAATLASAAADLNEMTERAIAHRGRVIKSTGDGLLVHFASAADAVSFALDVQRAFAERLKADPEALTHRIGIHLGDVFIRDGDVMGDGVNIAARLQHEAEPGGICISQTVFDVIRGKVIAEAVSIGPRELKNIQQSIHAYQLVIDAAAPTATARTHIAGGASAAAHPLAPKKRRLAPLAVLLALLATAVALIIIFNGRGAGPTEVPGLSQIVQVFTGPRGLKVVVIPLDRPADDPLLAAVPALEAERPFDRFALIRIWGIEGPFNNRIIPHLHRDDGKTMDYVFLHEGQEWNTMIGRDLGGATERWWVGWPGNTTENPLTYSETESAAFDRAAFLAAFHQQFPR